MSNVSSDWVRSLSLAGGDVHGRIVELGHLSIDKVLRTHVLPHSASVLLGEAITLSALVGTSLKFKGKLILQSQGDGAVNFLTAEYHTTGGVRGYARLTSTNTDIQNGATAKELLGKGTFSLTIDSDNKAERYQGIIALEQDSLSVSTEDYFEKSQQVQTCIRLAVAEVKEGDAPAYWKARGIIIQKIATEALSEEDKDSWQTAEALLSTASDEELADPNLSSEQLLFRLFHELEPHLGDATPIFQTCSCSDEKVGGFISTLDDAQKEELRTEMGVIEVTCEYCGTSYTYT